jgi:hypothetical protein
MIETINERGLPPNFSEVSAKSIPVSTPKDKAEKSLYQIYMPSHQQRIVKEGLSDRNAETRSEYEFIIAGVEDMLQKLPTKPQKIDLMNQTVFAHYFYAGSDWYILEAALKQDSTVFGYVVLNQDVMNSESGYISLDEIKGTGKIELDFYFTPQTLGVLLYEKYKDEFDKPNSLKSLQSLQKL